MATPEEIAEDTGYAPLPSGAGSSDSDAPAAASHEAPDDADSEASKKQQRRYYWTMALLNLLETGAAAGVSKFTPLFLAARGLDVAQVGVVQCINQIVAARRLTG